MESNPANPFPNRQRFSAGRPCEAKSFADVSRDHDSTNSPDNSQAADSQNHREYAANEPTPASLRARITAGLIHGQAVIQRFPLPAVAGAFALGFLAGRGGARLMLRTTIALGLRVAIGRLVDRRYQQFHSQGSNA